jgi:hypothetical protein
MAALISLKPTRKWCRLAAAAAAVYLVAGELASEPERQSPQCPGHRPGARAMSLILFFGKNLYRSSGVSSVSHSSCPVLGGSRRVGCL